MYQKLSIASLLALSAAAGASPSRFVKRAPQDLNPLVGGEADVYTTIVNEGNSEANEVPLLGPGIYTTIDGMTPEMTPEVAPETPDVQEAPVAPVAPVAPEAPEAPEASTMVDGQDEVPSMMPPMDSTFTEAETGGMTFDGYVPEASVTQTTPSIDSEPTTLLDPEDTTIDADALPTESSIGNMTDSMSFDGTATETSPVGTNQTTSLEPSDLTTATIYSTETYTITDCGPTVVCTGGADETLTSYVAVSTTICPVSEAIKFATVAPNPPRITVVDEEEVVDEVDGDDVTTTIPVTSTQIVTEFVTAEDAEATDEVVVVDEVEDVEDVSDEPAPSGDIVVNNIEEGSSDSTGDIADGGDIVDGGDVGDSFDDEEEATLTVSSTMTVFDVVTVTPTGSVEGSSDTESADSGNMDSGDMGSGDVGSGNMDSGNIDSGNVDSGNIDSGNIDSGNIDSGNVDSQSSGSDGVSDGSSDGSGSAGAAPECVPIIETVTERETVTEPVTIVETVTVAFTSDVPFVATMSNSTGLGSYNQTATHTVDVIACSTDVDDAENTGKPCGVYVVEVEPTPEAEVTGEPCCLVVDGSDNMVNDVPTSFSKVPKAAESPVEAVYGYDAYDSYESY